jgi:hypothetical protein
MFLELCCVFVDEVALQGIANLQKNSLSISSEYQEI